MNHPPITTPLRRGCCALMLVAAATAAAAAGAPISTDKAEVSYRNPAGFSGADGGPGARTDWLDELGRYVARRAARTLPDGERLLVTITDVQRAGQIEPWHAPGASDLRIVRDTSPPRIDLSFQWVAANGAVLKEGTRALRDLAFLDHGGLRRSGTLPYEKNLIDDWMRRDFGPTQR